MTRALLGLSRGGGSTCPRARAYVKSTCEGLASSHTRNAVKSRSQRFALPGTANPRRGCVSPSTSSGRSGRNGLGLSVTALILESFVFCVLQNQKQNTRSVKCRELFDVCKKSEQRYKDA